MTIKAMEAIDKIDREKTGKFGRKEDAMKGAVADALITFCKQSDEFAAAVADGGSFEECMKAVAKGVGSFISDLDAFSRAAGHYFPGAIVKMILQIELPGSTKEKPHIINLSLADLI